MSALIEKDQSAVIADHDEGGRIEMHQPIVTSQRSIVFAVQAMQRRLDEMHDGFVRRFASHARHFLAGFLFLSSPQADKHHQHARFDNVRVDGQGAVESAFGLFKVFEATESFEDAIDLTGAETVISKSEFRIQLNRAGKVFDGRVAILRRDGAKDEARKSIAATQIFFIGFSVDRRRLRQASLFVGTQLQTQPIDDAPGDFVLHRDDVIRRSIDAIAPNNFAALNLKKLRVNAKALAD